jgi:hypothetical protein
MRQAQRPIWPVIAKKEMAEKTDQEMRKQNREPRAASCEAPAGIRK